MNDLPQNIYLFVNSAVMAFAADGKQVEAWQSDDAHERIAALTPEQRSQVNIRRDCEWPAGESVGGVTRVQPAAEVMRELAQGAEALVQR